MNPDLPLVFPSPNATVNQGSIEPPRHRQATQHHHVIVESNTLADVSLTDTWSSVKHLRNTDFILPVIMFSWMTRLRASTFSASLPFRNLQHSSSWSTCRGITWRHTIKLSIRIIWKISTVFTSNKKFAMLPYRNKLCTNVILQIISSDSLTLKWIMYGDSD